MESPGMGTRNIKEHSTRPTRRFRNNNNHNTTDANKLSESKEQENVNNTGGEPDDADVSLKDEITADVIAIEPKVIENSTANVNTSTPRRKKNPLANLHSNLSPKYIGFTTPNEKLNSSAEERTRLSLRRRQQYNNISDTSLDREKDADTLLDDSSFTPSNESTVGYVRRTPRNKESEVTPDRSTKRKEFVSPIEKLLIKNGAVMEHNNNLLLNDNEIAVKRNIMQHEKAENISSSLEHNEETEEYEQQHVIEVIESCDDEDDDSDDDEEDIEDKDDENEEENSTHCNQEDIQNEETERQTIQNEDDEDLGKPFHENENANNPDDDDDDHDDVQEDPNTTLKPVNITTVGRVPKGRKKSKINAINEKKSSDKKTTASKPTRHTNESRIEFSANKEQNDKILTKMETESIETESNNDYAAVDATATANSPSAISMDSAKGSSIVNETPWMSFSTGDLYWGQIYTYCYWPCMVCPDPNGKTITTEERTGDHNILVHVRFFADNGRRNWVKRENLLPYIGVESYQERIEEVREKYGVKSTKYRQHVPSKAKEKIWYEAVNEANIVADIPYSERLEKFYEIFEKSQAFHKLEKQRRKSMYITINSVTLSDMESSYGSNDNINFLTIPKLKRERSNSPYSPAYSPIKSVLVKKRKLSSEELDENPTTSNNATSNTTNDQNGNDPLNTELNSGQTTAANSLNGMEIFCGLEFRKFYSIMKDFVMEQNHNEKLEKSLVVAVRNIWALKQLSRHQMECKLSESLNGTDTSTVLAVRKNGEGSVKRLSSRLKTLMVRRSLATQQTPESTPERSLTPKPVMADKLKKSIINRPILEVIDDIFRLDRRYLFRGMSREPVCKYCFKSGGNLRRCAKNCTYWLHADCLYKDFTQNGKRKRRRKPYHLKNINNNNNNNNNNNDNNETLTLNSTTNGISVINLTEIDSLPHVTGDNEQETTVVEVICKECANNEPAKCMVCNLVESKKDDDPLVKCCMAQCERTFHPACCKYWPQAKITISKNHIESFRCPSHVCHTCVSDDPKGKFQHISNAKLTKCVKCPATFHTDSTCIPAGSQIITAAHIICPRHTSPNQDLTANVNWCFICVGGGQLVCCETCPTAVHAHCLKIPIAAHEGYICEECESGRMPLYGEMVWAKFTTFRWWPAIILPPTEIPTNIARKSHNPSEFVVRFFGTHDHGWISRRRVYLYLEGDSSEPPRSKSNLDLNYNRGIEEAKQIHEIIKLKKLQQHKANENKERLHPQPYVRIKANRAVPPVRLHVDIESVSKCECDPREENPCGPDTNCLNRVLYHECNPKICPAGERCQNQMFESRISPRLDVVYMKERGFGLVSREPIKAGSFIIEYVGEVINDDEFQARLQQKSRDRDENFYFLSVEKDYIIDAGPKGNLARFMNHSCEPNCETQKWVVNSLNRVGLFAIKDIPENTELTFNYHWDDLLGNEKKTCYCGATKCAGQIGAKVKNLESIKESPTNIAGKRKTKAKRLLNGTRKNKGKLGNKLKLNIKPRGRKAAMAPNPVATVLKTNDDDPLSTSIYANVKKENHETLEDTTASRHLESSVIFC